MLKVIGGEQEGEFKAVASGTLPNGKPVVVNADGTVSVVSASDASAGTPVNFADQDGDMGISYDSANGKVVIVYRDQGNANYGTAVVGTVSGTSISFGTAVVFNSAITYGPAIAYSANVGKHVIIYQDAGDNNYGNSIVGTVSGTSISFGSAQTFEGNAISEKAIIYEPTSEQLVLFYRVPAASNDGTLRVGSVSGTSMGYGTVNRFEAGCENQALCYDSVNDKIVLAYRDGGNADKGAAQVATLAGSNISVGTKVIYETGYSFRNKITYDETSGNVVIAYAEESNSNYGTAIAGTVSGTSITFGTKAVFQSANTSYLGITYDAKVGKPIIAFQSTNPAAIPVNVSGTSLSFGTKTDLGSGGTSYRHNIVYNATSESNVVIFNDVDAYAAVYTPGSTNLTAENYIGMSRGVVSSSGSAGRTGSETVFEAATSRYVYSAYDSNSDKIVIAYADNGNLQYGTAIVGTVSGTTISFGSPVVFESAEVQNVGVTFDSNSNKVVITYADEGNSSYPTAIVGTVSGTSISFGTAVTIESVAMSSSKLKLAYDSNSGKVISVYTDQTNNLGRSAIGTVSGTSISFGTPVTFVSNFASDLGLPVIDPDTNKVIITYRDNGNSNYGTAKVGTISGTSISFGSASVLNQGATQFYSGQAYNPTLQKVIVAFRDDGDSNIGKYVYGTVSGTGITFSTEVSFNSGRADNLTMVYDPVSTNMVLSFEDNANSSYGTSLVFSPDTLVVTRGEVTDGNVAPVDIIGSVSENQLSLTASEKYYVQTDGTLSTTAGSPSVLAGTAISATKLVVKT